MTGVMGEDSQDGPQASNTQACARTCMRAHTLIQMKRGGGSHPESNGAHYHTAPLLRHSCEKWEHRGM